MVKLYEQYNSLILDNRILVLCNVLYLMVTHYNLLPKLVDFSQLLPQLEKQDKLSASKQILLTSENIHPNLV